MGQGLSRELARRLGKAEAQQRSFLHQNGRLIKEMMGAILDTYKLSLRGLDVDGAGSDESGHPLEHVESTEQTAPVDLASTLNAMNIDSDRPRPFTEEELKELFLPYQVIHVANHYIGDDGLLEQTMYNALDVLSKNRYLSVLDLGYNALTSRSVRPLIDALRDLKHLSYLSLSGNYIGEEGCKELAAWLNTDPPLESLSLMHCGFNDGDVLHVLNGLVKNTHLRCLYLDFNFLTWKCLRTLVDLVEQYNSSLAVVLMEGVPHDPLTMQVLPHDFIKRIEYACTPAGYFRSGLCYYAPPVPMESELLNAEDAVPEEDEEAEPTQPEHYEVVEGDSIDAAPGAQASAERFALRRKYLRINMAGISPYPPSLLQRLEDALCPRRAAYVELLNEIRSEELALATASVVGSPRRELIRPDGEEGDDLVLDGEGGEDDGTNGDVAELTPPPSREHRSRQGGWRHAPRRNRKSYSGLIRHTLPPLNSPERIEMVMQDARDFRDRRRIDGLPSDRFGEKILPNGFDRVWMAPLRESGTKSVNHIVRDAVCHLRACWCDPHDAAVPYAGTLHYHCRREEYIDYSQSAFRRPKKDRSASRDSNMDKKMGKRRSMPAYQPSGVMQASLDSDSVLPPVKRVVLPAADNLAVHRKQVYHGCQGTGHRCMSMAPGPGVAASTKQQKLANGGKGRGAGSTGVPRGVTVFTNQEGLVMTLRYNPIDYFSSAYQTSANIVDDNNPRSAPESMML